MSEQVTRTVLVPVARGTEEIEAVTIIDVLRRAGADVEIAACGKQLQKTCARGTVLMADCLLESCGNDDYSAIILPGGATGAAKMRDNEILVEMLHRQDRAGRLIGAICAAPAIILAPNGFLEGRKATCHPDYAKNLPENTFQDKHVVADGNLVTSQGPGTALEFTLFLTAILFNEKRRLQIAESMVVSGYRNKWLYQAYNETDNIELNLRECI